MATNMKYAIIGVVSITLVVSIVALGAWVQGPGTLQPQPIAFNHKVHIEQAGLSCPECHQFVTSQHYAGLPSKYICFDCHDPDADEDDSEADAFNPKFADLMAFGKTDGDIPWHRVTINREDVFFSHRRHVTAAKLDCRECHKDMPDRTSPPTRGPVQMSMDTCINCHEQNAASVDCVSCHR
jgi:hypothetical protein